MAITFVIALSQMKKIIITLLLLMPLCFAVSTASAQYKDTLDIAGATVTRNIPYVQNGLPAQNFDLYIPDNAKKPMPLIIWIHGGGWNGGFKGWIEVPYLVKQGYAIASIEYRFSTVAPFPAQVLDCNEAIYYLWKNAKKYGFDTSRFVMGGGSAGGHLASLIGASTNNHVSEFYNDIKKENKVRIRAVLNYYGPTDLNVVHGRAAYLDYDGDKSAINVLIGAPALERPDLAAIASPVTYIDKIDPPELLIHGDEDGFVPFWESQLYNSKRRIIGAKSQLIKVVGANHAGPKFQEPAIQQQVIDFLNDVMKQ
jgi:acetyl esterase/lipase